MPAPAWWRKSTLGVWLKGLVTLVAVLTAAIVGFLLVSIIGLGSGGPEVAVPNVMRLPLNQAKQELKEVGLTGKVVAEKHHSSVPEGQVIRTYPAGLTRVRAGRQVELTVSKGPREIKVPHVAGKSVDEATKKLEDSYLRVGEITYRRSDQPVGEVVAQSPLAGQKATRGESVDLQVSGGPDYGVLVDEAGHKTLFKRVKVVVPAGEPFQQVQISLHDQRGTEIIYDRIHEPGDEITLEVQARPGSRIIVYLDRKRVFEKRL